MSAQTLANEVKHLLSMNVLFYNIQCVQEEILARY